MPNTASDTRSSRTAPKLALATQEEADAFVAKVKAEGYDFVRFELPDMAGLSRGKTIPINHITGYLRKGLNLYGGTVALDSHSIEHFPRCLGWRRRAGLSATRCGTTTDRRWRHRACC